MAKNQEQANGVGYKDTAIHFPGLDKIINASADQSTMAVAYDSLRNRVAFALNIFLHPTDYASVSFHLLRGKTQALYNPRLKRAFVKNKKNTFSLVHEFSHWYADKTNKDLYAIGFPQMAWSLINTYRGKPQPDFDENLERFVSFKCLNEGFANWVQVTYSQASPDPRHNALSVRLRNYRLTGKGDIEPTPDLVYEHLERSQGVVDFIVALPRIIQSQDVTVQRTASQGLGGVLRGLESATSSIGYFFVDQAVQSLVQKGHDMPSAADLLLLNPPTQLAQLRDPLGYVKNLIST